MFDYFLKIFQSLKGKDLITFIGIAATFIISYKNLKHLKLNNKKSLYVNSVTKERIESMGEMKENLANYFSLVSNFRMLNLEESIQDYLKELEYRKLKIIFQLNPDNSEENVICDEFNKINKLVNYWVFYRNDDKEKIYPAKLLTIIDEYKINISNFYPEYFLDSTHLSKLELDRKMLGNFRARYFDYLEYVKYLLIQRIRTHLKEEWNKGKIESM